MACYILSASPGLKFFHGDAKQNGVCALTIISEIQSVIARYMSCAPASQTMGFNLALAFNFKAFDRCGYILTTYANITLMWITVICFVSLQA